MSTDLAMAVPLREPQWLDGPEVEARAEELLPAWHAAMAEWPGSALYLHPRLVLTDPANALVYSTPTCLAVLAPKRRRVRMAPGLGFSLRGRVLVGNQVLGKGGQAEADAFVTELAGRLRQGDSGWDFVLVEELPVESALWDALGRQAAVYYADRAQPHWWIDFPERPEDYWKQFSAKTRETLRRRARKLEHTVITYRNPKDVAEFLAKAQTVSARSWQGKRLGLRVRNTSEERSRYETIAAEGAWRAYVLEHKERPVAFLLGVQWQGTFRLEETAYDSEYAGFSPGTVLLFRVLQDLIAHDTPRQFDFGFGDAEYKRLFGNRQTESGSVLLVSRRLRPQAALLFERTRHAVSRGLRAASARFGILAALRRLYRQ